MYPKRRDILRLVVAAIVAMPAAKSLASNGASQAVDQFAQGAVLQEGGVHLDLPELVENGGAVPVRVTAEGARRIALFADGNPNPGVAVFNFGHGATPAATIRIRLAGSQRVIAVAEMSDGTYRWTSRKAAVTVGGC